MHRTCQDGFRPPSRAGFLSVGQLTIAFRRSPAESGRGRQFLRRMDFDFSFTATITPPFTSMSAKVTVKLSSMWRAKLLFESPRASSSRSYPGRKNLLRRIERLLLRSGMSTLVDTARTAAFIDGHIVVRMEGGLEMRFPVSRNPRLAKGTADQLNNIEISPFGLHWPILMKIFLSEGSLKETLDNIKKKNAQQGAPPDPGNSRRFARLRVQS